MIQLLLLNKIIQLLLMALMGYIVVKAGLLKASDSAVLSKLCLYLMLPCSILNSFQVEYDDTVAGGLITGVLAAAVFHLAIIIIVEAAGKKSGLDTVERNSVIYSNAANLIIPIVSYVLGGEWVIYTMPFMSIQLVFLWTHCVSSFRGQKHIQPAKIILNPNIIAAFAGIILMLSHIMLPDIINETLGSVGAMVGPAALIIIGMLAAGMDLRSVFLRKKVYIISALRLIAVPLAALIVIKLLMLTGHIEKGSYIFLVFLLATMTPPASTVTQFAQVYGGDAEYAGSINLVSTIGCMITMPVLVMLYMM